MSKRDNPEFWKDLADTVAKCDSCSLDDQAKALEVCEMVDVMLEKIIGED